METQVRKITPEIAKAILMKNSHNRPLKPYVVNEYARLMRDGLWKEESGEALKFNCDGSLIDGQHRLSALIRAGISLNFLIVAGLDADIFEVIDQGIKRSPGDTIATLGVDNPNLVASGIRRYFNLKHGLSMSGSGAGLSNREIANAYLARRTFYTAAAHMSQSWYKKSRIISKSEFFGLYSLFFDLDQDVAFMFCDYLSSGENLKNNDAIFILRNKLILNKQSSKKYSDYHRTALIIKAWNFVRSGKFVNGFAFDPTRENFPKPI